jgi:DNA-binding CsgD family transcriptional regulator
MLLGRDAEAAQIDDLLEGIRAGGSGTLVILGEPGIGKSALLDHAASQSQGMLVLRTRGTESESELAFSGLSDLLRPVLWLLPRIPPAQAAALEAALALGTEVGADRFTVSLATLSLLSVAPEDEPVLVVVDDAQWLDTASLEALLFVARRLGNEGIALLFGARDGPGTLEAAPLPSLLLTGLDATAAEALLLQTGHTLAPAVSRGILAAAKGNPLALIEIPALLTPAQRADLEPLPEPLPVGERLAAAFLDRVAELRADVRTALLLAASAESDSTADVVRALQRLDVGRGALEEAETTRIINLEREIHFRHPLLRSAVYYAAAPAEQRRAHRALAETLTGDRLADRRAWHLALATLEPDEEVARLLEETAARAGAMNGYSAAGRALEEAARLTPEWSPLRARRLVGAASNWLLGGRPDRTSALLDEVNVHEADADVAVEVRQLRARCQLFAGAPLQAGARLVEAANEIESVDPGRAALLLAEAALSCFPAGELAAGMPAATRALELGQRAGGPAQLTAAIALAQGLIMTGRAREASNLMDSILPILERADPLGVHHLTQTPAFSLIFLERFDEARTLLARIISAAREASAPGILPTALLAQIALEFRTGNWVAASARAEEVIRLARETQQVFPLVYALALATEIESRRGHETSTRAYAEETLALGTPFLGDVMYAWAMAPVAHLTLVLGHHDEAIDILEEIERIHRERGITHPALILWRPDLAEAYIRAGRTAEARVCVAALADEAERAEHNWARAVALRLRGMLAEGSGFEADFQEALRLHELAPSPFERARTELCLGEMRRRAGHRVDARAALRSALTTFERLGAELFAERARSELRVAGDTPQSPEAAPIGELTPQELQVALVVARGASNREAAAELFLSAKTIDFHLQRIYRKLGIRSRTQLARLLSERTEPRTREGAFVSVKTS